MRKHTSRTERIPHVPVMPTTRRSVATAMHTALAVMRERPTVYAYDTLAGILSSTSLALANARQHAAAAILINRALLALQSAEGAVLVGAPLRQAEVQALTAGVNAIDEILPRLDFNILRAAEAAAVAERRAMRAQRLRTHGRA